MGKMTSRLQKNSNNTDISLYWIYLQIYMKMSWGTIPDIGIMVRVFANDLRDLGSIPDRVIPKTKKWYLMPPCLTLSIIRYRSRVKWSNPGKEAASSPTLWCSSYRKRSLWITLDYGHQLYLLLIKFIQRNCHWIQLPPDIFGISCKSFE